MTIIPENWEIIKCDSHILLAKGLERMSRSWHREIKHSLSLAKVLFDKKEILVKGSQGGQCAWDRVIEKKELRREHSQDLLRVGRHSSTRQIIKLHDSPFRRLRSVLL